MYKIIIRLIVIELLLIIGIFLHEYDPEFSFTPKPNTYAHQNYGRSIMYMIIRH